VKEYNAVHRETVETGHFGEQNIVFTNFKGKVLLKELKSPQGTGVESCVHYRVLNNDGRQTYRYHPKAVLSYSVVPGVPGTPTRLSVSLSPNEGMIEVTEYLDDPLKSGRRKVVKRVIKQGISGTPIIKSQRTYEKRQIDARVAWKVTSATVYEDEANTKPISTQYAYTYHPNSLKVEQKTTTYPAVPTSQNGSGVATSRVDRFDAQGRPIWSRDELGIISYRQYNAVTGSLVKTIQDVNTTQTADFTVAVPSGWITASGAGKHLVSEFEYDFQGRMVQTLGPRNTAVNDSNQSITVRPASWMVYDDANFTVRSASGFATMNGNNIASFTLANPVSITIRGATGEVLEQIRAARTSTSGKLQATDTFARVSFTAWSKNLYQSGRLVATRQYHLIPANGDGAKNTNYLETTFGYDTLGRRNTTTSPDGTITKVDFDWKGNAVKTWVGTTDTNLVVVSETEYGDTGVCSTCTGQKDKPRVAIQHVDANTMRITEFGYDWRGRQVYTFGEEDAEGRITYAKQTYDNLNRGIKSERFLLTVNTGNAQPTGSERLVVLRNNPNDDILLARSEQFHDVRGRVWKTEQSVVNPQNGAVQGKLLGQSWYDAGGRVLKQIEPGANHFTKFTYDSLGRVTRTHLATNPNESGYAAASSLTNNTVFTQSETTYDNLGNAILQTQIERLSTASGTGALTITTGRYQSAASWFDGVGRMLATANYGTNNGVALTRPAIVPARSDNVLVSETRYDVATGRAFRTIDPAAKDHRTFVDALGRTVKTVANFTGSGVISANTPDQNVTVEMTYHPSGQIATLTAKNPTTGDQITRYVYGSSKAWLASQVQRNDLLAAEIYPDSDDFENANGVLQNGPDRIVDRVEFQYNRLGERIAKRDQNGTVHTYEYDNLGRLLHDRVTTLAGGVDGAVRRISTVYDVVGNMRSVTSFNNAAIGSGTVVNQVLYEYDANGLLVRDFSNPNGAVVVASTPHIGYTYNTAKSGEFFTRRLRPTTMKYPSGKTLTGVYGTTGSNDDLLCRVTGISEGATSLVQYAYNGAATPIRTTYPQPNLMLDYTASGALDRFGRITDHAWRRSAVDVARIQHGYDRVGNRTHRRDVVQTTHSELYGYDGVNQVKSLNRGTLNAGNTAITASNFTETWNYDMTGNWAQFNRAGVVENRTHNAANETQTVCTHDRNGNMTVMPGLRGKYDAWNRLVEVLDTSNSPLATYAYNGLNHRVRKTVGGVVTTSFFNRHWQELESVSSGQTTVNIWGQRYIDDLVLRERGAERLYSLADPNWNVVAITNAAGTVQERMRYDAFGRITWLNAAFAVKANSGFAWNRAFTGQVLDSETGLMLYRMRYLHTGVGRFVNRDSIEYLAGDVNLYRYVFNMPVNLLDPLGLQVNLSDIMLGSTPGFSWAPMNPAQMTFTPQEGSTIFVNPFQQVVGTNFSIPSLNSLSSTSFSGSYNYGNGNFNTSLIFGNGVSTSFFGNNGEVQGFGTGYGVSFMGGTLAGNVIFPTSILSNSSINDIAVSITFATPNANLFNTIENIPNTMNDIQSTINGIPSNVQNAVNSIQNNIQNMMNNMWNNIQNMPNLSNILGCP